jgi:hydrogenase nickel incorporation protein HypA/HybF
MHEMGIASSIMEAVATEVAQRAPCRVVAIGLRIGDLAAVDEESLRFCFEVLVRDTEFAGTHLRVERTPGPELDLAYLELEEDDGAHSARAQSPE